MNSEHERLVETRLKAADWKKWKPFRPMLRHLFIQRAVQTEHIHPTLPAARTIAKRIVTIILCTPLEPSQSGR